MDESLTQDWRSFELYEKVRIRERRKKALWISAAMLVFFGLCSIPVVKNRYPKWESLKQARVLAVQLEKAKTFSIQNKKAVRVVFSTPGEIEIRETAHCKVEGADLPTAPGAASDKTIEKLAWAVGTPESHPLVMVSEQLAKEFGLDFVFSEVCFDPVLGLVAPQGLSESVKQVLIIVPAKDLTAEGEKEKKLSRASFVELRGPSATLIVN